MYLEVDEELMVKMSGISDYEIQRLKNIEHNKSVLRALGLPQLVSCILDLVNLRSPAEEL